MNSVKLPAVRLKEGESVVHVMLEWVPRLMSDVDTDNLEPGSGVANPRAAGTGEQV